MPLFLILLSVPIIEIALFVTVGERIGLLWTLTIVVLTALIGATALRSQGFAVLRRAQSFSRPEDVSDVLIDGLFLLTSGLLLLTPGFLTDTIGFLLLIPAVRRALAKRVGRHAMRHVVFTSGGYSTGPEPRDEPPQRKPGAEPSHSGGRRAGGGASPWAAEHAPEPDRDEAEEAVVLDQTPPPSTRGDDDRR